MNSPKTYCPYCELELHETGHKNEVEAWDYFNCEFNPSTDHEKPVITELFIVSREVKDLTKRKNNMNTKIRGLKARKLELEKLKESKNATKKL